ncbi:hypothetical protein MTR67_023735 [Solanum verrucosum]|uniref:Uncharacterized protein n=1 Tax=Solanum verrucosum TaxID=315347 RepID=A0AAF0QX42_SOLVR|nr:hypothetical protein MTR67_023735 [Solanum verrucosum]
MDFMKSKKELDNNPPSYSSILMDDENIEVFDMNDKKEVILILEENDLKWRNEPWQIMARKSLLLKTVEKKNMIYLNILIYLISGLFQKYRLYQMDTFEKLGLKQVVKTTEETITIDSDNQTFRLLSNNDLAPYRDVYRFMHIGLVQVAFKPLTLRGLPESFIAALRDGRNHNWKKCLIGTIQIMISTIT